MTAVADYPGQRIVLPGQSPGGEYVLGVLLKRTYRIVPGRPCVRANADRKLVPGDVHYDDPMNSSVRFESDFVPFKLATDVVLNATAVAPGGRPTRQMTVAVQVGQHRKELRVTGDRIARYRAGADPVFTDPEPFVVMDLRYERAYGGVDVRSDPLLPFPYPRNHLGKGFAVRNDTGAVDGLELPNIEDPADVLTPARVCCGAIDRWQNQPQPQGFGWYSKYSQPRAALAGVMPADRKFEQELRTAYAKLLPPDALAVYEQTRLPDMNFRFFNGASPGLAVAFLTGDEPVRLTNLTPDGLLSFRLPGEQPRIALDIGKGPHDPGTVLHTVQVRLDENEVDLVWRAAVPYPGPEWLPEMRKMDVVVG